MGSVALGENRYDPERSIRLGAELSISTSVIFKSLYDPHICPSIIVLVEAAAKPRDRRVKDVERSLRRWMGTVGLELFMMENSTGSLERKNVPMQELRCP